MPIFYEGIIDNFNIYNFLILEKIVNIFYIKETKFMNLRVIKEENISFTTEKRFYKKQYR